jgi:hypothetical protein
MSSPRIDSYRFGQIVVDGQAYTKDIIILPQRVIPNWWRKSGHNLSVNDLEVVFEAKPQVLVVGQGSMRRMRVSEEIEQTLQKAGIELIALPSGEAWQRYNELRQERRVAAAIHLTC